MDGTAGTSDEATAATTGHGDQPRGPAGGAWHTDGSMDAARRMITATMLVVAAGWIVLDQATKLATVRSFSDGSTVDLGPLVLRLIYNEGGAFSLPIQLPWLYVGVAVVVCVLVLRALPQTDSIALAVAYGLVVGGAIGNAADRLFRDGAVVDMLDLDFPPLESFPVFNVADVGITVGAGMVAILLILAERREAAAGLGATPAVLDDHDEPPASTARTDDADGTAHANATARADATAHADGAHTYDADTDADALDEDIHAFDDDVHAFDTDVHAFDDDTAPTRDR